MILLLILTILLIAVELPVTILYKREDDVLVLGACLVALMFEIMYMRCVP